MWTWKDENAFESVRSLTGTFWVSGIFFLPPEVPLLRTYQVVYLHTPPSFLTKKRRSWELEGGSFLFFFPFWKLQRPVQPAASHPLQLWLSWHPDASHEAGVWSREYWVLDRSCLFFFYHDAIFQRPPNEAQAYETFYSSFYLSAVEMLIHKCTCENLVPVDSPLFPML